VRVGAHVPSGRPLEEASLRDADVMQIFLSNPHQWRSPLQRTDAEALGTAGIPIYVHAPYLINVVSGNPRLRNRSRRLLAETVNAAESVGAVGVVVHGGHATGAATVDEGLVRWEKTLKPIESPVPILIEDAAGGENAMVRSVEDLARLWDAIGDLGVGVCLDTCHAWAAGEDFQNLAPRVMSATGRIDLVHANDSKDGFGSRRDRHTNLGDGQIPPELLIHVIRDAGAAVVVETPGGAEAQAADIEWIRTRL